MCGPDVRDGQQFYAKGVQKTQSYHRVIQPTHPQGSGQIIGIGKRQLIAEIRGVDNIYDIKGIGLTPPDDLPAKAQICLMWSAFCNKIHKDFPHVIFPLHIV